MEKVRYDEVAAGTGCGERGATQATMIAGAQCQSDVKPV